MKILKLLGLLGLGFSVFLLTGCGSSANTLTCTTSEDGTITTIEMKFNSNNDKLKSVDVLSITDIPDTATDEQIEYVKDYLNQRCSNYPNASECSVSQSGKKISFVVKGITATEAGFENENISFDDAKKNAQADGYSCE